MGRVLVVAHVPGHLDRKAPEVDRGRQHLQPRIMGEPAADQIGQRRDVVRDGDHLGDREEVGDRDRDLALELLPRQRLEQPGANAAGQHDVDVLEPLELAAAEAVADFG